MFNYYEKHLDSIYPIAIQQIHQIALSEAFFHGSQILNAENLFEYKNKIGSKFISFSLIIFWHNKSVNQQL